MGSSEIRKLRDRADKARLKGQSQKALELYDKLCRLDPQTARWPHQRGEILRRKGQQAKAVEMFLKAAQLYLDGGFGVQAVAEAKVVLDLEPGNERAREILGNLAHSRQSKVSRWAQEDLSDSVVEPLPGTAHKPGMGVAVSQPSPDPLTSKAQDRSHPPSVEVPSAEDFSFEVSEPGPAKPPPPPVPPSKRAGPSSPPPPPIPIELSSDEADGPAAGGGRSSASGQYSIGSQRQREATSGRSQPDARAGAKHSQTPPRRRTPSVEIELGSRETLDGLILRDVVRAIDESMEEEEKETSSFESPADASVGAPLSLNLDHRQDTATPRRERSASTARPVASSPRSSGGRAGGVGAAGQSFTPAARSAASAKPPPIPDAIQRVEDAESEVSIVRAVSAFEVDFHADEVDDMLESVFPEKSDQALIDEFSPQGAQRGAGPVAAGEPSDSVGPDRAADMLKGTTVARTPLFGELPTSALETLVAKMRFRQEEAGAEIVREGEAGGELFVVVEGTLDVTKNNVKVGEIEAGSFFGEIAIVTDMPRQATVKAATQVQLLEVSRELVVELIQEFPEVVSVLMRFFRRRMIGILLNTSPLFSPLDNTLRRELAKRFKFLEVDPGVRFIKQARPIPGLFVLLCGEAKIIVVTKGNTKELARLGPGDVVGETSLLSARSAATSTVSKTKCWMLFMPAKDLREAAVLIPEVVTYLRDLSSQRVRAVEEQAARADSKQTFPVERLPVY
jgi:cAMP-dependent protein kinase regulator